MLASGLMLIGVIFNILAAIGILRFPGTLAKMHAATKSTTLGLSSVLLGSAVAFDNVGAATQLLLVMGLQLVTAPIAAHMIGKAAYRAYRDVRAQLSVDELGNSGKRNT